MKNVKTLLIFITISTFIFASGTRVDALGGAGFWADDYANIGSFPASVNNHQVAWTDGTDFTSVWNEGGTTWGFAGGTGDDVANVWWGNGNMGVNFGLGMSPAVDAIADDATTLDVDETVVAADAETAVNIGFGMPLAGMDFGFTYGMGCGEDCGGGNIGVNLRRAQNIWLFENILIGFGMKTEDKDNNVSSNMGLSVDMYRNTTYDSGISSLFALGFGYSDEGEGPGAVDPDALMAINWNFAVESAMTDWATLRIGYSHGYDFSNGGTDGGGLVVGLGFNYESFNLDMNLNTDYTGNSTLFNDPVKYISGRNTDPLGAEWTISYNW